MSVRGADGWTTKYVGIPSNSGFSAKTIRLDARRSRQSPEHVRLRRARNLRSVLRRRLLRHPRAAARRHPRPGHAGLDPADERQTVRLRRPLPVGGRQAPRLRHDHPARARGRRRRADDLRARSRGRNHPGRLDRPERELRSPAPTSASSACPTTAPASGRNRSRRRHRGQRVLAPVHAPRLVLRKRRPGARHDLRGPLRRDDRRRVAGVLHHGRPARFGRHRRKRRHLRSGGRQRRQPGPAHRLRRVRRAEQRRRLHPGRASQQLELARPATASAARSPSPAAPGSPRTAGPSTSSAPSSSTARKGP